MKVLMLNGSPNPNGTTNRALTEIKEQLFKCGIESEIICVGNSNATGCIACRFCVKNGKCVKNDIVNEISEKMKDFDGLIVGSPVYYASINGTLKCILDRLFYSGGKNFAYKPACGIVVARRAGTTSSLDILNKYFGINNMPIVTSQYWDMAFGSNGNEVEGDGEGLQTMRTLAKNMAWLLKCIEAGKQIGEVIPESEPKIRTGFIK